MNQHITAGESSPANLSSAIEADQRRFGVSKALQIALLLLAGAIAFVLHKSFRWPLQMPGHHGIEWLAILVTARLLASTPAAGLTTGIGAAGAALLYAGSLGIDGKTAQMLTYLLQGAMLDVLFSRFQKAPLQIVWVPLTGALVHSISPLVKNAFLSAGEGILQFGSLVHGIGYPLTTHAAFGAIGAAIGLALHSLSSKKENHS